MIGLIIAFSFVIGGLVAGLVYTYQHALDGIESYDDSPIK